MAVSFAGVSNYANVSTAEAAGVSATPSDAVDGETMVAEVPPEE